MAKYYLNNKDLLSEILKSKTEGNLTPKAIKMLMLLSERAISRLPYIEDYLREEALSGAIEDILKYWDRFDENKSENSFSYYTQIAKAGAAKSFNICYQYGKKFKGTLISMEGSKRSADSDSTPMYNF